MALPESPAARHEVVAGELLGGMAAMEDVLRSSGQYGPTVAVAADAPVVDRLMGFVGRDGDRSLSAQEMTRHRAACGSRRPPTTTSVPSGTASASW
jgi:hypothetical protein